MTARRLVPLMCCLLALALVSCAGKKPRDPKQTYVDEIKYGERGETIYMGIFTTRPVASFYVDSIDKPRAVLLNLKGVNVSDIQFPRRLKKHTINKIETKTETVGGQKFGQVWFHLNKDVSHKIKATEYGLRLDLTAEAAEIPPVIPEEPKQTKAEPTPEDQPLAEAETIEGEDELALAEDLKELEEEGEPLATRREPRPKAEEPTKEIIPTPVSPTAEPKLINISRELRKNRERIILRSNQSVDYQKRVLDREIVIELMGTDVDDQLATPLENDESLVEKISTATTEVPYKSAKIVLSLRKSAHPKITKRANEVYIDFVRRKEITLIQEATKIDFGGYLSSPTDLPGREISIHSQETDLRDIFKMLSVTSDYNIIVGRKVKGKAHVRLVNVPWDKALVSICEAYQLGFVKQGNIIRVSTLKALYKEKHIAAKALRAKQNFEPMQVMFLPIQVRKAFEMKRHLYPLLSKRGSMTIDSPSNTLIIRDIPNVLHHVKEVVASLDNEY